MFDPRYEPMMSIHPFAILAAIQETDLYVNPIKIGVVVVLVVLWALAVEWVDRDTDVVKTKREQWNLTVLSGGFVAFLILLIPPWTGHWVFVGMAAWLGLAGGAILAYVIHRNGRVVPSARILTRDHFTRVFSGSGDRQKAKDDKGLRVRIADHAGKSLQSPTDPEEAKDYQAVQDFLFDLLWRRASDADMVVTKEKYRLVYRVDGVATERTEGVALEQGERVVRYLKRLAGLNVEEIRRPQTGRIRAALLGHDGEIGFTEVTTSGTTAGERLRLRIQSGPVLRRINELGIAPQRLETLKGLVAKPTGLLLISAQPQNGMTTTQYAILRTHDAYMQNIYTLERRKLVDLDNVTQRVFEGTNTDVNYARMLQTVLRREPDVVMISECEDRETAQIATRAAIEDRKIYMGIHGKDAFDALAKYLAFMEDNKSAGKALIGVLHQRLIRVLCTNCRESFRPDPAKLKKLNLPADKIECFHRPPTKPLVDKKGREIVCPSCQGTGYVNRTGLFELLAVDPIVTQLITEGAGLNKIKTQCRKNRMLYLQEEGLLKGIDGTTSIDEIIRGSKTEGE